MKAPMRQRRPAFTLDPSELASMTPERLRHAARAAGREVWERVGDGDAYACQDVPDVLLTRFAARRRSGAFFLHTTNDALASDRGD